MHVLLLPFFRRALGPPVKCYVHQMRILNVAEKNDAAKNIAEILGNRRINRREGLSKFNKIYEFGFVLDGISCNMIMTSVSGHLLNYEFPTSFKSWHSFNPLVLFDAPVSKSVIKDGEPIRNTLQREVRNCQKLILWTDCDREGENIGVEIAEVCKEVKPNIEVLRAKFSEITPLAIRRAIEQLGLLDYRVSDAVDARQELDLRIGAAFTRFQTLRLQRLFPQVLGSQLISYGSCQFPTLGFVVERFIEVDRFIPEPFWRIVVTAERDGKSVDFHWKRGRLFDEDCCRAHYAHIMENRYAQVVEVTRSPKSRSRPVALNTVEMEKLATRKLRIGAKTAMQLAERLYTRGFVSYPRTETNIFPSTMDLASLVRAQTEDSRWADFSNQLLTSGISPRNGKSTDKAHPPIHPLKVGSGLQGDEARLFELITRHFLASLSADAKGAETSIRICVGRPAPPATPAANLLSDEDGESFEAKGLLITEPNYLVVYTYDRWFEREIPNFTIGDWILPTNIEMLSEKTVPPPLLTEADLIALMDHHGIGTDATHADHIETIKQRLYVGIEQSKFLVPGQLGMGLVEGYDAMGLDMSKPKMRADLEADLRLICDGRLTKSAVLHCHISKYKDIFQRAMEQASMLDRSLANRLEQTPELSATPMSTGEVASIITNSSDSVALAHHAAPCPVCSRSLVIRQRRATHPPQVESTDHNSISTNLSCTRPPTWFLSCSGYPQCRYAVWFPDSVTHVRLAMRDMTTPEPCTTCLPRSHPAASVRTEGSVPQVPFKLAIRLRPRFRLPNGYQQDDENQEYITCVFCDTDLQNTLGIRVAPSTSQFVPSSESTVSDLDLISSEFPMEPSVPIVDDIPMVSRFTQHSVHTNVLTGTADENSVVCNCGCPAVVRTVRKAGPNQGRLFYRCGGVNASSCDFFLWKSSNGATDTTLSGTHPQLSHNRGPGSRVVEHTTILSTQAPSFPVAHPDFAQSSNDPVLCRCGEPAKLLRVTKATANQGREFYACPNGRPNGESGCGFFLWADGCSSSASSTGSRSLQQREPPTFGSRNRSSRTLPTSSHSTPVSLGHVPMWPPPASTGLQSSSSKRPLTGSRPRATASTRKCGLCGEPGHTRTRCSRANQLT